jgi:hypothetical protein
MKYEQQITALLNIVGSVGCQLASEEAIRHGTIKVNPVVRGRYQATIRREVLLF